MPNPCVPLLVPKEELDDEEEDDENDDEEVDPNEEDDDPNEEDDDESEDVAGAEAPNGKLLSRGFPVPSQSGDFLGLPCSSTGRPGNAPLCWPVCCWPVEPNIEPPPLLLCDPVALPVEPSVGQSNEPLPLLDPAVLPKPLDPPKLFEPLEPPKLLEPPPNPEPPKLLDPPRLLEPPKPPPDPPNPDPPTPPELPNPEESLDPDGPPNRLELEFEPFCPFIPF